ncbi:phospholipase D-like domain-containing protein [Pseudobacteriovorax antillogorgiicola]|uniref:PLD-like domain-containing protein n=1 Tax=Pseudobacteriovorax antillogorgiicola TaxID=1513793 RepID=A0A1Y6BY69_9BACT|nr:phospholipase D-like domain-containing protein [Pseudobacteriovorax antillogorgiicola]TCS53004.1 phospholipase D-like protein [Pseudobacteriovorax antillogorgiicola]SMF27049.1 PLD-like domain-containing protein [Pseudobacteriovorax antillogorgiicola]
MRPNYAMLILYWAIPALSLASDYQWQTSDYEVLFTNPTCPEKQFVSYRDPALDERVEDFFGMKLSDLPSTDVDLDKGIPTVGGGFRKTIAANTSCSRSDKQASVLPAAENDLRTKDSPYVRAFQWINQALAGDSVFVTSMSFSDSDFSSALCDAAIRGANVKVFINSPKVTSKPYTNLSECPVEEDLVTLVGYSRKGRLAHMKSIVVELNNPEHQELSGKVRFSFQSGNISDGMWGHQENWNFVTLPKSHWAAQDHICLRDTITVESMKNLGNWYYMMNQCRVNRGINSVRMADVSFMNFFVPISGVSGYDDEEVLAETLQDEVARSSKVRIAAHYLTEAKLIAALKKRLIEDESFSVELLLDDELAWSRITYSRQNPIVDELNNRYFAPSDFTKKCFWGKTEEEADKCWRNKFGPDQYGPIYSNLVANGAEVKFFEANHMEGLLFHHKFIIFEYKEPYQGYKGSVFTGAGNLSSSGFTKNFENYYLVRVPHVVTEFNRQYDELKRKAVYESELPITWNYTAEPILDQESGNGDEDGDEGEGGESQENALEAGVKYEIILGGNNLPQDGSSLKALIKNLAAFPSGSSVFKNSYRVVGSDVAIAVSPSLSMTRMDIVNALQDANLVLGRITKL